MNLKQSIYNDITDKLPTMDKRLSIIFAALIVILAILNMTYGAPQSMNVWEFFDWISAPKS